MGRMTRRGTGAVSAFVILALAGVAPGCYFFPSSEREYFSNADLLAAAAEVSGFGLSPDLYRLVGLDVSEDSMTCRYRGVAFVGDHAWVVRFSEKSSEQDPVALGDVYSLLPLIRQGRDGFKIVEEGEREEFGTRVKLVRYRFDSPIRDGTGTPLVAHGMVASLRTSIAGFPVVYHLKLDNHGDRDDVNWRELYPFVEAATGR